MKTQLKTTVTAAVLGALSVALVLFTRIPMFTDFLEFELSDTPIFITTLLFGPVYGLISTVAVSIIQGFTVSAHSGLIGIIMHIFATGSFVLVFGLYCKKIKTTDKVIAGLTLGCLTMTATMVCWNLLVVPFYNGVPVQAVAEMLLPVFIPFNLIKSGANACVTFAIYKTIYSAIKKYL